MEIAVRDKQKTLDSNASSDSSGEAAGRNNKRAYVPGATKSEKAAPMPTILHHGQDSALPTGNLEANASSSNEIALCAFVNKALKIKDVHVLVPDIMGQHVIVFVPTLLSDQADKVYEARAKIHRAHPLAALDVRVKGLRERGLEADNVTDADLQRL